MPWFWCQLYNNTGTPVRVITISQYGQGLYYLNPGQYQWVSWYPGVKVLVAFDQWSGNLVTTYPFFVSGPTLQTVAQSPINPQPGGPTSGQPPVGTNFSANT